MNNFLENLKKGLETGDYNSDAAKKIMEISELSESKKGRDFEKRLDEFGLKKAEPVSEEKALEANKLAELAKAVDVKNTNAYKMLATIENYEIELNDAFFKLKEYYDLVKLRLNDNIEELTTVELELFDKVNSVIDLDRILSIKMSGDIETYLVKVEEVDDSGIIEESKEISEISEVEEADSENDEQINLYKKL